MISEKLSARNDGLVKEMKAVTANGHPRATVLRKQKEELVRIRKAD